MPTKIPRSTNSFMRPYAQQYDIILKVLRLVILDFALDYRSRNISLFIFCRRNSLMPKESGYECNTKILLHITFKLLVISASFFIIMNEVIRYAFASYLESRSMKVYIEMIGVNYFISCAFLLPTDYQSSNKYLIVYITIGFIIPYNTLLTCLRNLLSCQLNRKTQKQKI